MGKIHDFKAKLEDKGWRGIGRSKNVEIQEGLRDHAPVMPGLYMPDMWLGRRQEERMIPSSSHLLCACAALFRKQPGSWE